MKKTETNLTKEKVDQLEKYIAQLSSFHSELSAMSKKSPNDAVNNFKLKFINKVIEECNIFLGTKYIPLSDFSQFDSDDVPSNSDVTFIISQYIESFEKYRSDNIIPAMGGWYYNVGEEKPTIRTSPPKKLKV